MQIVEKYLLQIKPPIQNIDIPKLIGDVYDSGLIYSNFNWIDWANSEGVELEFKSMDNFKEADLPYLIKYSTYIFRNDRFCEGFIEANLKNGTLHGLFLRLNEFSKDKELDKENLQSVYHIIDEEELARLLSSKYNCEKQVSDLMKSNGFRLSVKKFTADLGEYYAIQTLKNYANEIASIEQNKQSNSDCDAIAVLNNGSLYNQFNKTEIRIEIKTRRDQRGSKYLSSLKPYKFDLLCVVDMNEDYSLNQVFLVTTDSANANLDTKYNRLIFKENMAFKKIPYLVTKYKKH